MSPCIGRYRASLVSMVVALTLTYQVHAHTTACDKAKVMLGTLDSSLRVYAAEHGAFPSAKHWIDALVRERSIRGPNDARDPWGHDYVFVPGEGDNYDLRSVGPDGKQGTQDDLVRANGWNSATCRDPAGCGGCGG